MSSSKSGPSQVRETVSSPPPPSPPAQSTFESQFQISLTPQIQTRQAAQPGPSFSSASEDNVPRLSAYEVQLLHIEEENLRRLNEMRNLDADVDVNKQCAVRDKNGKVCKRDIEKCQVHGWNKKREVVGRRTTVDLLIMEARERESERVE